MQHISPATPTSGHYNHAFHDEYLTDVKVSHSVYPCTAFTKQIQVTNSKNNLTEKVAASHTQNNLSYPTLHCGYKSSTSQTLRVWKLIQQCRSCRDEIARGTPAGVPPKIVTRTNTITLSGEVSMFVFPSHQMPNSYYPQ
jgi:hypothetical protein